MKKVRYLTVSRVAIELVSKLSVEEKALFIDILYNAFKQVENGEQVTVPAVDGVMNVIMDETISELETGFTTYMKRVNATKKRESEKDSETDQSLINGKQSNINDISMTGQRDINDLSMTDQRSTIEEKRIEEKRKEEKRAEGVQRESNIQPVDMNKLSLYTYQIISWLQPFGIGYDESIKQALLDNGIDIIRKAVLRLNERKQPVDKVDLFELIQEERNKA